VEELIGRTIETKQGFAKVKAEIKSKGWYHVTYQIGGIGWLNREQFTLVNTG